MSQSSPDPEQQAEAPGSKIHQESSGNMGGGQQAISGNYNSQNQDNSTTNIYINPSSDLEAELPENLIFKSKKDRLLNYLKTIFFLFSVLVAWGFMGLFASQAFPNPLAKSLLKYTFEGSLKQVATPRILLRTTSSKLWEGIKRSIENIPSLSSIRSTRDIAEAKNLSKLDSQYWLLSRLAEGLQGDINNFDEIFWKVRDLEEKRNAISSRLEPLKKLYLKDLDSFQILTDSLLLLSNRSKKYDEVENILNGLVQNYVLAEDFSELQVQELIEVLRDKASKIPNTQSLYNVWRLIDWMHVQSSNFKSDESEILVIDSNYPPIRALKIKHYNYVPKYHIPNGCVVAYPRVENPEDEGRIDFYESIEEAEKAGRRICDKCQKKL